MKDIMVRSNFLVAALLLSTSAFAQQQGQPPAVQPQEQEQQQPQEQEQQQPAVLENPYLQFNKRVQEALKARALYDGPVNGDIGPNTQAAIAQFQLSESLPASGMLDEETVLALGVERAQTQAAGETAGPESEAGPAAGG